MKRTLRRYATVLTTLTMACIGFTVCRWAGQTTATNHQQAASAVASVTAMAVPAGILPPALTNSLTANDGLLPEGVQIFDNHYPGITNLDAQLLQALRQAATKADALGIAFIVNSGWRSADYQNHLLRQAEVQYGSSQAAARWVATAETSAHVSGKAVDIGGQ
ncbi:MAG: D-alanyl-D-alanine carboxypeptidase family protein, partial [Bifidobacteriaceae bacterium]|nr:D-alanyl-D-alanine carboxypeptidase family protein [Bifidobacteriaceae bacterium]